MIYTEIITDHHYGGLNPVQFGHQNCDAGHSFGPAVRTHWLLHYVISGFGTFEREGTIYKVGPGQMFVIPPYLETYYEADGQKPWKYIWIGFTTKEELPEILRQAVVSCPAAGSIFDEMISCSKMENGRSAFLSGCLWKLMGMLLEQTNTSQDYIDKALAFMHSEYINHISIQEISDRLGLDRSYFYKLFMERTGTSPSEYLIRLRLKKAAELMTVYGERPSIAAFSVGYEDLVNFSKMFKKYYGMSPRNYIKQWKSDL